MAAPGLDSDKRFGEVITVVAAYWVVSISMVYINKVLLSTGDASLQAPLFITMFQSVVSCGICIVLGNLGDANRKAKTVSFTTEWSRLDSSSFNLTTALSVLPLSFIFVGMVALNNLCLQYVEVSFYNVARCLSLVFNVVLSYLVLGKSTSWPVCSTLVLVIVGFAVGIDGEINFSFIGTCFGILSSLFVSLSSIFTAKVLPLVSNDKSLLIFYNNANAVGLLIPLILFFEGRYISENFDKLVSSSFWICMILASVLGFSVALVTVLQIKVTSPLTHNISGTAKAAVQSLMAFYIWGNQATLAGVVGLFLVLIGSALYALLSMRESAGGGGGAGSGGGSGNGANGGGKVGGVGLEKGGEHDEEDRPFLSTTQR